MVKSLEIIILELIELFRPHLEEIDSVLDIGTGTSIPIHVFAEIFPEISYYTADIQDIRKRRKLPFVIYDGNKLPFHDNEFDISILNETLHHCEKPEIVLIEAQRVAKSVFLIEHFPIQGSDIKELIKTEFSALKKFGIECKEYKPFTEYSLNILFEKTGLKVRHKSEIPYKGKRKIEKYFFILEK